MKFIVLAFFLTVCFYKEINAQDFVGTNDREKKVLRLINALPEIVKENQHRKKAHVKCLIKACIQNTPTKTENYYKVSISEDLGFQLRTYDWYEVDARNYTIKYDDMITGKSISLAAWRRQLRSRKKGV
ncbi:hypothetical protein [Mucilaginibacter flavidus]|uniref:hypothetical protein n=1 Tax=Mucilaginibacter flavidus TaxID=2949309 RepID=UPI00209243FA|nr:hypothetical protein [Mucilaginibacter flavidus]MCO5948161.1 hypothetical protein [Mucilaginibacter flavidus]